MPEAGIDFQPHENMNQLFNVLKNTQGQEKCSPVFLSAHGVLNDQCIANYCPVSVYKGAVDARRRLRFTYLLYFKCPVTKQMRCLCERLPVFLSNRLTWVHAPAQFL